MEIDAATLSGRESYRLLISSITPRPIAWVGTRSADGVDNLAPFSFFMGVTSRPPSLAISVVRPGPEERKHTARNILSTGEFTVSIPSVAHIAQVAHTAAPWEGSEFSAVGLTPVAGPQVDAPRPAEAQFSMSCRLLQHVEVGNADLLVGQVVGFHVDDALIVRDAEGRVLIDTRALDPLARLGGVGYTGLGAELTQVIPKIS